MVGSSFILVLGFIILLLVKDSNAFNNIQGMKKVEFVKDAILVAPTRENVDTKKVINVEASRVSEIVDLEHGRGKLAGGRKMMKMQIKQDQLAATSSSKIMSSGANKLSATNLHRHDQKKLKSGVFMSLNADYGRLPRTHPPRNN